MLFKSIDLKNFLSVEEAHLDFIPGNHIILGKNNDSSMTSANGSGKSALLESILFALYKDYPRKDICKRGEDNSEVKLTMDINNKEYIITRTISSSSKTSLSLSIDSEDVSSRGVRNIEKDIIKSIGLQYLVFTSSIFVPQGFPVNLSQMTPTVRKNVIESLLGLLVWEEYQNLFSIVSKDYESRVISVSSDFSDKKEQMISLNSRIEGLKEASNSQIENLKKKIEDVKSEILSLKKEVSKIDAEIESSSNETIETLMSNSENLLKKISKFSDKKANLERSISDGKCFVCGQKYSDEIISNFSKELENINKNLEKYSSLREELKTNIDKIQELLYSKNKILSDIENKGKILLDIKREYSSQVEQNKISELEVELNSLVKEVNDLKSEQELAKSEQESVSFICKSLLPSSKFRTKMIENYVTILNQIIEEISLMLYPELKISLVSSSGDKGIDLLIKSGNSEISYLSLSGGEKRRIDLILTFSIQRFLMESSCIDSNLIVYDEIFDNLDYTAMSNVLSVIPNIFGEDKCIFVVSHNENIKSIFDSMILVEKTNGISTVNFENYH